MIFASSGVVAVLLLVGFCILEINSVPAAGGVVGIILGLYFPFVGRKFSDCLDRLSWQSDLRNLRRGGELNKKDKVRISFAYLFRIKLHDKYFLVLNGRGTQKYQPVGGAYQYNVEERTYLCNKYKIVEDDKIQRDDFSRNDYRLFVSVKYLKSFIKRFDKTINRECINDLSREFKEELIQTGILDFTHIKYRFCGRHFTKIQYSRHFNCYELLLADIVELEPTDEQRSRLGSLINSESKLYKFASSKEIKSCGIDEGTDKMVEIIGDHTIKILQDTEEELLEVKGSLRSYKVSLNSDC